MIGALAVASILPLILAGVTIFATIKTGSINIAVGGFTASLVSFVASNALMENELQSQYTGYDRLIAASDSSAYDRQMASVVCDGVDDDATINDVITAVTNAGGGVIRLAKGTYKVTNCVLLRSNVTLEGVGQTSEIKMFDNSSSYVCVSIGWQLQSIPIVNVTVRNLTVNGNGLNAFYGLAVWGNRTTHLAPRNVIISNCYLRGGADDTALTNDYADNVTWDGCYFIGNENGNPIPYSNSSLEVQEDSSNVTVKNCHFLAASLDGNRDGMNIGHHPGVGSAPTNVTIENCIFTGLDVGINIDANPGIVRGCTFTSMKNANRATQIAGNNITWTNNTVTGATSLGMYIHDDVASLSLTGITVENSTFQSCAKGGIEGNTVDNSTFQYLTMTNNGTAVNNTYYNLRLSLASNYNNINHITILETASNKTKYGLYEPAADGNDFNAFDYITFTNASKPVTGNYLITGAGSTIAHVTVL